MHAPRQHQGALVGVEAVTPEGLKAVYKDWNYSGDALAKQLQTFKQHGVHVLGSFIFGLPTDRPATFDATVSMGHCRRAYFRPIRHDDSVSRHCRLWQVEKNNRSTPPWSATYPSRVYWIDSDRSAAQDVHSPPHHELR